MATAFSVAVLSFPFSHSAPAQNSPDDQEKIVLDSFSASPDAFSPALGRTSTFTASFSIRYTDLLGEQSASQNFRFFLKTRFVVAPSGATVPGGVTELPATTDLTSPPRTPSQQSFSTTVTFDWNGMDAGGVLLPDGSCRIDCSSKLWREKLPEEGASPSSGGQLKLIGTTSMKTAEVTIDGTPPQILGQAPAPGEIGR